MGAGNRLEQTAPTYGITSDARGRERQEVSVLRKQFCGVGVLLRPTAPVGEAVASANEREREGELEEREKRTRCFWKRRKRGSPADPVAKKGPWQKAQGEREEENKEETRRVRAKGPAIVQRIRGLRFLPTQRVLSLRRRQRRRG